MRKLRALLTRRNALVLAAGIALWHLSAFCVLVLSPAANNGNYTPDRISEVTYKEFAGELGLTVAPMPLTLDFYEPSGNAVDIRVQNVFVDPSGYKHLALESRMRGHVDYVVLPYDEIEWATGPAPSIELTYGNEVTEILQVGKGYNYGRFITLRGAESYAFDPAVNDDGDFLYTDVSNVIENAETIKITVPNDPAWQKAMGKIG